MSEEKDLYDTLGVSPDATDDEIKRAYRERARETHPDHGGDIDEFKMVSLAGTVLTDAEKRRVYDETGCAESDKPIDPVRQIIAELVDQCFLQQQMPDDPIRWMQDQIDCERTKIKSMIAQHDRAAKDFNVRLTMFNKNNEQSKNRQAVSFIAGQLRAAIRDEEAAVKTCKQNLQHHEDAMVFLNDVRYPKTVSMRGAYEQSSNWQVTRNNWGGWPS